MGTVIPEPSPGAQGKLAVSSAATIHDLSRAPGRVPVAAQSAQAPGSRAAPLIWRAPE